MIYIDCDGVLADFHKKVLELTGTGYNGKETWKVLEKYPRLFYNLDVMQGARESVAMLVHKFRYSNVEVLTALPLLTEQLVTAHKDKVQWVHKKIDPLIQVNAVQNWRLKKYFCNSIDDILIDDNHRNIIEWEDAGGRGILHTNWDETLKVVECCIKANATLNRMLC